MTKYHAQPYNPDAKGFYFKDQEDFETKSENLKDRFGQPVEEFEIQLIDADTDLDAAFIKAYGLDQTTIDDIEGHLYGFGALNDDGKIKTIIAMDGGYYTDFDDIPHQDIDVYYDTNLKDLAEQFIDDGLFGEIPSAIENYIDYEAIAADLKHDYTEDVIAGQNIVYRRP